MTDESDRRIADRHAAYMGAEVTTPQGKIRSAITQDASATGFLLLTRAALEVGSSVSVRVFLPGDVTEVISATVVRREPLDPSEVALWREKVAVQFERPLPAMAEHFQSISEKQRELFGKRTK
jgi:hypothetical protein